MLARIRTVVATTSLRSMTVSTGAVATSGRLQALRSSMASHNLAAYIVPSEDAHQSEYIADCDARREYITGFTGSAGLAVVTMNSAALWTDGRYFLQASQQLDANWILQKTGLPDVPSKEDWLIKVLPPASRVGIDPTLLSVSAAELLRESLVKAGHELFPVAENLVDIVWKERPVRPSGRIVDHPVKYAGKSREDKFQEIRQLLAKRESCWGLVVSSLDEIAWMFNLRGSDIAYNPVFFSYALITSNEAVLFVDESKFDAGVALNLKSAGVSIRSYDSFFSELEGLSRKARDAGQKLWIDHKSSLAIQTAVGGPQRVEESRSPIQEAKVAAKNYSFTKIDAKAIKNGTELDGFRSCHIRDAAALCHYFAWLEDELLKGSVISEVDAADKLESLRAIDSEFVGLSFDTISSSGSNGAIIHYKPTRPTCRNIDPDAIYLCDSGAQYRDGTTDVTRTMHFGTPRVEEIDAFTRVLQGHIRLDMAVFPRGTTGYILDVISRTALWKAGLDFRHGTGHGVGSHLNVHEGPHGIGSRIAYNEIALEAGMVVTNEPGYYEDGKFGIRIENVMLIKDVETKNNFGGRGYLGFEHVTVAKLVNADLLNLEEREWLNAYNAECFNKVAPHLAIGSLAYEWLKKETAPL